MTKCGVNGGRHRLQRLVRSIGEQSHTAFATALFVLASGTLFRGKSMKRPAASVDVNPSLWVPRVHCDTSKNRDFPRIAMQDRSADAATADIKSAKRVAAS